MACFGVRFNPDIAAQPDRADEVIYSLRACLLSVQADGLVRANENFMAWLRGEKTMPFGHNGEHVPVRLVDAVQIVMVDEAHRTQEGDLGRKMCQALPNASNRCATTSRRWCLMRMYWKRF